MQRRIEENQIFYQNVWSVALKNRDLSENKISGLFSSLTGIKTTKEHSLKQSIWSYLVLKG